MLRKNGMDSIFRAFEQYLKSIENFQAGGKVGIPSDNLDKLERLLLSGQGHEKESSVDPNHKSESFSKLISSIENAELIQGVIHYTKLTKIIYKETQYNKELYDTFSHSISMGGA